MAIIMSGLPTINGIAVKRRLVSIELSADNPTVMLPSAGAYEFRLDTTTLTRTSITVNTETVTVADVEGQFVWDEGGEGEHTFTYVGETIYRTYGGALYHIGWLGLGSQRFFARSVLDNKVLPLPPSSDQPPVWGTPSGSIGSFPEGSEVSFQLAATDDNGYVTFALTGGSLPAGLSLSSSGLLSGTAPSVTSTTSHSFTVTATDDAGQSADRVFSMDITNINQTPVWETDAGSLATVTGDAAVSTGVLASDPDGTVLTYHVVSGSLPPGLTLDTETGAITGTATNPVGDTTSHFTIRATDNDGGYTDRAFNITVTQVFAAPGSTLYTTAGGVSFTVPKYVTSIRVLLMGGGGKGGTNYGGGGGSGYLNVFTLAVTPGQVLTGTVGAGATSSTGGATSFAGRTANGGQMGGANDNANGGSGGSGGGSKDSGFCGVTAGWGGRNGTASGDRSGGTGQGTANYWDDLSIFTRTTVTAPYRTPTGGTCYGGGQGGNGIQFGSSVVYAANGTNGAYTGGLGGQGWGAGGGGGGGGTGAPGGNGLRGCIYIEWG